MLLSQGFRTTESPASKIVPVFNLCDERLSLTTASVCVRSMPCWHPLVSSSVRVYKGQGPLVKPRTPLVSTMLPLSRSS